MPIDYFLREILLMETKNSKNKLHSKHRLDLNIKSHEASDLKLSLSIYKSLIFTRRASKSPSDQIDSKRR